MAAIAYSDNAMAMPSWNTEQSDADEPAKPDVSTNISDPSTDSRTPSSMFVRSETDDEASDTTTPQADPPNPAIEDWADRRKPSRGIWPSTKSEPTAVLSTARSLSVSSTGSMASATSAVSALHLNPQLPHALPTLDHSASNIPPMTVVLQLYPVNDTFKRKTIHVPFSPGVVRIGRQTNAKSTPLPTNAYFDSKVLSRQHAEVFADREGRVYIRDVKSSNGTFVNSVRLSPENTESEPREIFVSDIVELGINIVSEDQTKIVHHKVSARIDYAGPYPFAADHMFADGELVRDPSLNHVPTVKRSNSGTSMHSARNTSPATPVAGVGTSFQGEVAMQHQEQRREQLQQQQQQQQLQLQQQQQQQQLQFWSKMYLQPLPLELLVKRLNHELVLAKQQAQDIARAQTYLSHEVTRSRADVASTHVGSTKDIDDATASEPFSRSSEIIQPVLRRADTFKPTDKYPDMSSTHVASQISSEDSVTHLEKRITMLERELDSERSAKRRLEDWCSQLEQTAIEHSTSQSGFVCNQQEESDSSSDNDPPNNTQVTSDTSVLQALARSYSIVDDMKRQLEAYRRRAEHAEADRDMAHKTLAEMVHEKRSAVQRKHGRQPSDPIGESNIRAPERSVLLNDLPKTASRPIFLRSILDRAGVDSDKPLSVGQAVHLQRLLDDYTSQDDRGKWKTLRYHAVPHACAVTMVVLGIALMHHLNGWDRFQSSGNTQATWVREQLLAI